MQQLTTASPFPGSHPVQDPLRLSAPWVLPSGGSAAPQGRLGTPSLRQMLGSGVLALLLASLHTLVPLPRWPRSPGGGSAPWRSALEVAHSASKEHVVAQDGSGEFNTVQDAVAAVPAGEQITVRAGTYTLLEPLTPTGPLHLQGDPLGGTVIQCANPGGVLNVRGTGDLELRHLSLVYKGTTPGTNVASLKDVSGTIAHCRFTGIGALPEKSDLWCGAGLLAGTCPQLTVTQCQFSKNGLGMAVAGGKVTARRCTMSENIRSGCLAFKETQLVLDSVTIEDTVEAGLVAVDDAQVLGRTCTLSRAGDGVLAVGSAQVHLENSIISGCTSQGTRRASGVRARDNATLKLTACSLARNQFGAVAHEHAQLRLSRCTLNDHSEPALVLNDQTRLHMSESTISRNLYGLVAHQCAECSVEACQFDDNKKRAVEAQATSTVDLYRIECHGNGQGIAYLHASSGSLRRCHLYSSDAAPFLKSTTGTVVLEENLVD